MRSPLALGTFEGWELAGGFKDLSTTVELGQASNAMRRASPTLDCSFDTAKCERDSTPGMKCLDLDF